MRGSDERTGELFSYVDIEERIPQNHPLRLIRRIVNEVLAGLDGEFAKLYAEDGRPSIAPERLLRALLLQAFYTIRSERQLMEQLHYNLLYRWFVGLGVDDPVWVPTVFSKNRDRLLRAEVARKFLSDLLTHKEVRALLSDEHFWVDGTPEAKLYKKGKGKEAKLSYIGNIMTENRNGFVVEAELRQASGTVERGAATAMIARHSPGAQRITVGGDKNFDTAGFVADMRALHVTPHVAQNTTGRRSAIDGRTTCHPGYAISQQKRKRVEEPFGWGKTVGGLARPMLRGVKKLDFKFIWTMAAYDLIKLPRLIGAAA